MDDDSDDLLQERFAATAREYEWIGRYLVGFSEVVATLRAEVVGFARPQASRRRYLNAVLAGLTAQPLADAFFEGVRSAGGQSEADRRITTALRREVLASIEQRNAFAHGDWQVGWTLVRADSMPERLDPTLIRFKLMRAGGAARTETLSVTELQLLAQHLDGLEQAVRFVGLRARNDEPLHGEPIVLVDGRVRVAASERFLDHGADSGPVDLDLDAVEADEGVEPEELGAL